MTEGRSYGRPEELERVGCALIHDFRAAPSALPKNAGIKAE